MCYNNDKTGSQAGFLYDLIRIGKKNGQNLWREKKNNFELKSREINTVRVVREYYAFNKTSGRIVWMYYVYVLCILLNAYIIMARIFASFRLVSRFLCNHRCWCCCCCSCRWYFRRRRSFFSSFIFSISLLYRSMFRLQQFIFFFI